jgi:hypothetical protein
VGWVEATGTPFDDFPQRAQQAFIIGPSLQYTNGRSASFPGSNSTLPGFDAREEFSLRLARQEWEKMDGPIKGLSHHKIEDCSLHRSLLAPSTLMSDLIVFVCTARLLGPCRLLTLIAFDLPRRIEGPLIT